MKTQFNNSIKNFAPVFLMVAAMFVLGLGCKTPDPLAGWQKTYGEEPSQIVKDYQDYIQKLPPEERNYVGPVFYYKDSTGQQALTFEVDKYGKDVWSHYLFYDKNNKRIKVVKYYRGQYWNP